MREKNLLLNKEMWESGMREKSLLLINKCEKVGFDSGFDKNNPKVVKEKVWKKIRYG